MTLITVERKVLEKNDVVANDIRLKLKAHNIFSFNLLSSPGSGKTSLVERTIAHLKEKISIGVIEGDVQTDLDAQRIDLLGVPVAQIVTNGGCHLDAGLVRDALTKIDYAQLQILIIENVGNLVCPAGFDLGEETKVVLLSTTEGDDKPLKYPAMFRNASVLIINKIDLLPYVNCSVQKIKENALAINPDLKIFETSCTTDAGIPDWCNWILAQANQ
ncbi:MAG: hydrogenase accessory protein HypB [Ignavibacteria bacterium CG_4_8_14_3_um_filter_37_9]|nr:hydrogenase nickel incorporation protein HypB [Ignavibacteria bacterium]PIP78136.1 MAG: hydrogenase accessory protein HypB [Ignavibacteria bacterium CG22_combo_CG10-13_8_21_14_all_37_15]PIS44982.1 MAG: hydrogenase accessory protein HypB [Ignavibacteria bacterium CG08_land_8_20_14_0_20_37_9]PIW98348.1 MAG: hydrogenase accessory protein HypB [Ignavibacteria bacterium CG_4_8_14_3_um_filter_37_9]PIX92910.1 MAG: hydrogenase accessory protein HypB [Ignavibacteria bacterium CG_4_10_14_3_um_filter_3